MLAINITEADGTVHLFTPAPHLAQPGENEVVFLSRVAAEMSAAGRSAVVVNPALMSAPAPLPADLVIYARRKFASLRNRIVDPAALAALGATYTAVEAGINATPPTIASFAAVDAAAWPAPLF